MGKLKSLTFQAESDNGEKLNKNTFKTITSYKIPTTIRQIADKSPIISSDREVAYDEAYYHSLTMETYSLASTVINRF